VRMIDKSVSYANINVYNDNYFKDKNDISSWALPSVNFAYDKGIMQGVGNNCIDPQANTTCEQAVLLVYRTVDKYYNAEAQLDSIYELTEEHIAQDEETFVHYTDNIILAFVEKGLTEEEKENIADVIDGNVVAQLAGSINLLQVEVESSTLDELGGLAERLSELDNVYYASPDILLSKNMLNSIETKNYETTYVGEDGWWIDAIEAKYVWDNYDKYITSNTVGVLEVSSILTDEIDYADKLSFVNDIHKIMNDIFYQDSSHATIVTQILAANRNDLGITGISHKSSILYGTSNSRYYEYNERDNYIFDNYIDYKNIKEDELFVSEVQYVYIIKQLVDRGAVALNCSFAQTYYTKDYFDKNRDDEYIKEFENYEEMTLHNNKMREEIANITAACTSQLVKEVEAGNCNDFLIVPGAGNGTNNDCMGYGVNATNSSYWAGITDDMIKKITKSFDISCEELESHYIVVGAVRDEKVFNQETNTYDYFIANWSNYGDTVDIYAPGENIYGYINGNKALGNGTSFSAPMVTGTAAVLWGIDPTLTAAEVKDFILKGSKCKAIGVTGEDVENEYPMLNVRGAVEKLLKTKAAHISVGDKDTNGRIQGATVSYGNGFSETTDIIGSCDIYLVDKNHEITISKEGYKPVTVTVEDKYIGQEANSDIIWLEEKEILLEKEKVESPQVNKFNIVAEYNGKVYSGIEGGDAIHVGEPGETTKFCIIDDYIYYYHTHIGHAFGDNYHDDFLTIWRTDLNGNNKVCVGFFEQSIIDNPMALTKYTCISNPCIINNTLYLSINQYDEMDRDCGWTTWMHNMGNATVEKDVSDVSYLYGDISELVMPDSAKYIVGANNDYIFYLPFDPLQYGTLTTGISMYNVQKNVFFTLNTDAPVVEVFANDEFLYYTTNNGTYKYNFDNGQNMKITDFFVHYIYDNVGYFISNTGGINAIDLSTLETTSVHNGHDNIGVILATDNYLYISKDDASFYGQINVQYNRKTGEEKIIAKYEYPN